MFHVISLALKLVVKFSWNFPPSVEWKNSQLRIRILNVKEERISLNILYHLINDRNAYTWWRRNVYSDFATLVNRLYSINIEEQKRKKWKDRRSSIEGWRSFSKELPSPSHPVARAEEAGTLKNYFYPGNRFRGVRDSVQKRSSPKMGQWKFIAPLSGCPTIEQMSRMLRLELVGLVLLACTQILTEHRNIYETRSLYGYRSKFLDPPERFTREVRVKQGRLRGIVVQPRTNHDLQPVDVFLGEIRGWKQFSPSFHGT